MTKRAGPDVLSILQVLPMLSLMAILVRRPQFVELCGWECSRALAFALGVEPPPRPEPRVVETGYQRWKAFEEAQRYEAPVWSDFYGLLELDTAPDIPELLPAPVARQLALELGSEVGWLAAHPPLGENTWLEYRNEMGPRGHAWRRARKAFDAPDLPL